MTLNNNTAKTCQIIDGELSVKHAKINIFSDEDLSFVKKAEEAHYAAKRKQSLLRQNAILEAFRKEISAFVQKFGAKPTLCLMNYRDVDLICDAWNAEQEEIYKENRKVGIETDGRDIISTSSSYDKTRFVDGVRCKQGCDQQPGQIRFYSAATE
jgi:hypothetical protein